MSGISVYYRLDDLRIESLFVYTGPIQYVTGVELTNCYGY